MNWSDVGNFLAKSAPLIGGLLGGAPGAALGKLVSSSLGTDNTPDAVMQELKANPDAILKLQKLEMDHKESLEKMHLEAETAQITQTQTTMRAELANGDKFKSYWRPLFGYMCAVTWLLQSVAIVYAIIARPADADKIIGAIAGLATQWGIALAILGINIHARSNDKKAMLGQQPGGGLLGAITQRIAGAAPAPPATN